MDILGQIKGRCYFWVWSHDNGNSWWF